MGHGCASGDVATASDVISMRVATTEQFLFPLAYADATQGAFEPALTSADFFVCKKVSTLPDDAVIRRTLGSGIAEEVIDGVRHLVVSLSPSDTLGVAPGAYVYAMAIGWGGSDRTVIATQAFDLKTWPGHPPAI